MFKKFNIRKANEDDCKDLLLLIKALALYEKASEEVITTVETIRDSGFGKNPIFYCFVAEIGNKLVGASISYVRYSTWKGKTLYLEDIIVEEKYRGKGIGKALFEKTMELGKQMGLERMDWQVLYWNTPAFNFYKKYPFKSSNEWVNCTLDL